MVCALKTWRNWLRFLVIWGLDLVHVFGISKVFLEAEILEVSRVSFIHIAKRIYGSWLINRVTQVCQIDQ